jgi:DNA-binding response OmpR family regulator
LLQSIERESSFAIPLDLTFSCGKQFLESTRVDEISCLILDVQMPGLSGLDLQDRLIASGRDIPVIFITRRGRHVGKFLRSLQGSLPCVGPDHRSGPG